VGQESAGMYLRLQSVEKAKYYTPSLNISALFII
jgi:hypothetical protein